jgi:hypothetical protein
MSKEAEEEKVDAPGTKVTVSLPALMMSLLANVSIFYTCNWR